MRRTPIDEGMSVIVGTVSPDGLPAGCRAICATSADDLKTMTVYVPMATSREVVANVATTRRLAVVGSYPPDHSTMQVKGTTTNVRLAHDSEQELLRLRLDRFADVLHLLGVPRRMVRSMSYWPAFAIDMNVEEVFEQTPGPKAGTPLR